MRKILIAGLASASLLTGVSTATSAEVGHTAAFRGQIRHGQVCHQLFTVKMAARAVKKITAGTRTITNHNRRVLGYLARCQNNPHATSFVHAVYHGFMEAHNARVSQQRYVTRYNGWAIPSRVVFCESDYQNLPPNSASASGYYQMTDSTWQSWASSAGLTGMPSEAYLASRTDQGLAAGWGWDHDGSSPWTPSSRCSGY